VVQQAPANELGGKLSRSRSAFRTLKLTIFCFKGPSNTKENPATSRCLFHDSSRQEQPLHAQSLGTYSLDLAHFTTRT
jgi:hypothetical protein